MEEELDGGEKYCIVCGDVCPRTSRGYIRANAKYCSDECRKEAQKGYQHKYFTKRYHTDEEFRNGRKESSMQWMRNNREKYNARQLEYYHKRSSAKRASEQNA